MLMAHCIDDCRLLLTIDWRRPLIGSVLVCLYTTDVCMYHACRVAYDCYMAWVEVFTLIQFSREVELVNISQWSLTVKRKMKKRTYLFPNYFSPKKDDRLADPEAMKPGRVSNWGCSITRLSRGVNVTSMVFIQSTISGVVWRDLVVNFHSGV